MGNLNKCFNFGSLAIKKDFLEVLKLPGSLAKLPKSGSLVKTSKNTKDFQSLYLCGFANFQLNFQNPLKTSSRARVITWKLYIP